MTERSAKVTEKNGVKPTYDRGRFGGTVRAAERSLQLLDALAMAPGGESSLSELCDATELPKSTIHRLLMGLVSEGYVERGEKRGVYGLGLRIAVLGYHAVRGRSPSESTQGLLEQVSAEFGLAVSLTMLDGTSVISVARGVHEGVADTGMAFGSHMPAYASAAGKVLLSRQPSGRLKRMYVAPRAFERFTPNTISTPSGLQAAVERVRARGYAVDDEESSLGLRCVAVPLRQGDDQVTYAFGACGPSSLLTRSDVPGIQAHLAHLAPSLADRFARMASCP